MISNHEKLEVLEAVFSSNEFSHSKKCREFLKYLVDCSLHNKDLDEMSIAAEFFGKDSNFNPLEDASIRVYISTIRRRLTNYYLTQGKDDKIQIDIPKGSYVVRFRKKNEINISMNKSRVTKLLFPALTLLLSFIVFVLWLRYDRLIKKYEIIPADNPIWAEYLQNTKPTIVILGDYFFMYSERGKGLPRINLRDPLINSLEEYQDHYKANPNKENILKPLVHAYLRPGSVWGGIELLPILRSSESPFHVQLASEIVWEDINSHNIIFIGTFKTMYILKALLEKLNIGFSIYPNFLYLNNKNGEEMQKFEYSMNLDTRQYKDYGLFAKFSGPNNNTLMLISGFDDASVIYTSKTISNPNFPMIILKDFGAELKEPCYFKMVLEVEGFRRTDLSSKIEYFEIVK